MKAGHFIIIGLIIWTLSIFINSIWIHKSKGHLISAIIIAISSITWLTNKENRKRLWGAISTKGYADNISERLTNSIQVGLIAIFSLIVMVTETTKELVRQSDGFIQISNEISKNVAITDKVGHIEYIAIENSAIGLLFKDSKKILRTSLTVFGDKGKVAAKVEATRTDNWQVKNIKLND
jgi:hypothetical protein